MSCGDTEMSRGGRGHFQRTATAAAEYYRSRHLPERLEQALTSTFYRGPEDVYGHLANYFAEFSKPPVISDIRGRKVLDGAGKATLEAEVLCTVRNADKRICTAIISADCEFGPLTCEAAGASDRDKSVEVAIDWIQSFISSSLKGIQPNEQGQIDQLLSDFLKLKKEEERERFGEQVTVPAPAESVPPPAASPSSGKKKGSGKGKKTAALEKPIPPAEPPAAATRGSLAVGAVSLAVAKCSAVLSDVPLYSYISALRHPQPPTELVLPTPLITLLSYGKSSPGKLNLMKEVMVVPKPGLTAGESLDMASSLQSQISKQLYSKSGQSVIKSVSTLGCLVLGCDRIDQPLDLIGEACQHLALELGTNVFIAINCAAHELMDYSKGKYEVSSGTWKSPDELVDLYVDLISRHPAVVALVDPFRKEDREQYQTLGKAIGSRCYIMAEMALDTVTQFLQTSNTALSSGPILKYTNETTVSDLLELVRLMEGEKLVSVLGCTSEECSGDSLTDLAVGLGMSFIKLGGLLRGERTDKYNRLLAIEEDLAHSGRLGSRSPFQFPALWSNSQSNLPAEEDTTVRG
ncbi:enolase 4 isoform X1 [Mixophyes fleayi]|uniref:enolase 4 isoform X1 n=1 Tax=Mixophyes fleayi TaxID=3061075 RepID=UPI003F4E0CCF